MDDRIKWGLAVLVIAIILYFIFSHKGDESDVKNSNSGEKSSTADSKSEKINQTNKSDELDEENGPDMSDSIEKFNRI